MRFIVAVAAVAVLAACSSLPNTSKPSNGAVAAGWPAPNDRITPGSVTPGCTYPRPPSERDVTATTKTTVAKAYGWHGPGGIAHVEYDHRVPFALCGGNGPANIWPEPADGVHQTTYVHNRKDQLEDAVIRLVRTHRMTLAQGQAVFEGDWRTAWCRYVHAPGVAC